jgi:UDP-N-acetylglucosamine diphosphorylase / glucose-1-phosphate thymidylyltransferase / UDP-N-acetylgalactosamine diphosphorylase / glucosamine-1-phosphate N-acetyltransferase / galactosamine-1-phosphate N-acetyltransferase
MQASESHMPNKHTIVRGVEAAKKPLEAAEALFYRAGVNASEFFAFPLCLSRFAPHFPHAVAPWDWLKQIGAALAAQPFEPLRRDIPPGVHIEGKVWIDPSVKLPAYATIIGPAWIGPRTDIRPNAFIRGNVIVGEGCVLGNSSEYKNCLLLDGVQTPHYNYVGDSILGNNTHLGAGVICSNLRLDQAEISVRLPAGVVSTGLRKFGAVLGDDSEVGCNAVLNPGTILGRRALVMPCTAFSGYLPAATIARSRNPVTTMPRRD